MSLTVEQSFKVGFLLKCAELGLTIEETHERVKTAITLLRRSKSEKVAIHPALAPLAWAADKGSGALSGALGLIPGALSMGGAAAIGAPVVGGAMTGYLAAKATGANGQSMVGDAKQDELTSEYERLAEEARRRARIKRLQEETGRRIVALTPTTTNT